MSPDLATLPNFFIVGAPNAGVTCLHKSLDQHPAIYMSPLRETNHFATEIRPHYFTPQMQPRIQREMQTLRTWLDGPMLEKCASGIVSDRDDYTRLFARATHHTAIGEASVYYLWSRAAAPRIAARIPQAKILIILRNPVDRAFAQYLDDLSQGVVGHSFRTYLQNDLNWTSNDLSATHPFLQLGLYANQLQRFQENFPASQIRLWLYEDTTSPTFLPEVLDFLGVDPTFTPATSEEPQHHMPEALRFSHTLNKSGLWGNVRTATASSAICTRVHTFIYPKQSTAELKEPERNFLSDYYRADIQKLQTLLNRDLSHWLQPEPQYPPC